MEKSPVPSPKIRVQPIQSGLQPRRFALQGPQPGDRHAVYLADGAAVADCGATTFELAGPAVLWLGCGAEGQLNVGAGASGYLIAVGDELLTEAIGNSAESASLSALTGRCFQLGLTGERPARTGIADACQALDAELRQPQRGSPLLLAAYLRIIMVTLMRVSGVEEVALASGGQRSEVLQRFRQLVEAHFREHWTVTRYAGALGLSRDRLHATCTSQLGRSPKALVAERVAREASLRLERSTQTIEQLSHALGFRDPAHFSNFFKRMTGLSPGRYRKQVKAGGGPAASIGPASFAEWP